MPSFGDKNVDDRCQEESEIDCYWDEDAIQEQLIGEKIRIEQTKHVEIFQNVFSCASMSDKTILDYPVHKTGFIHNYECMQLVLPRLCTKLIAGQKQFPIKGLNLRIAKLWKSVCGLYSPTNGLVTPIAGAAILYKDIL